MDGPIITSSADLSRLKVSFATVRDVNARAIHRRRIAQADLQTAYDSFVRNDDTSRPEYWRTVNDLYSTTKLLERTEEKQQSLYDSWQTRLWKSASNTRDDRLYDELTLEYMAAKNYQTSATQVTAMATRPENGTHSENAPTTAPNFSANVPTLRDILLQWLLWLVTSPFKMLYRMLTSYVFWLMLIFCMMSVIGLLVLATRGFARAYITRPWTVAMTQFCEQHQGTMQIRNLELQCVAEDGRVIDPRTMLPWAQRMNRRCHELGGVLKVKGELVMCMRPNGMNLDVTFQSEPSPWLQPLQSACTKASGQLELGEGTINCITKEGTIIDLVSPEWARRVESICKKYGGNAQVQQNIISCVDQYGGVVAGATKDLGDYQYFRPTMSRSRSTAPTVAPVEKLRHGEKKKDSFAWCGPLKPICWCLWRLQLIDDDL